MGSPPGPQSHFDIMGSGVCISSLPGDSIELKPVLDGMGQAAHHPEHHHYPKQSPSHLIHHSIGEVSSVTSHNLIMSTINDHPAFSRHKQTGCEPYVDNLHGVTSQRHPSEPAYHFNHRMTSSNQHMTSSPASLMMQQRMQNNSLALGT